MISADARRVILGSLLYTAGSASQYVTPAYFSELATHLTINEAQMGSIAAAENVGIGVASLLTALCLTRISGTLLATVAAVTCTVLNVLSYFLHGVATLIAVRFLTGSLGEGVLFALAFTALGATRNPDRSLGIGLTTVVAFGSLVLGASRWLDGIASGPGILLPLAGIALCVPLISRWMPMRSTERHTAVAASDAKSVSGLALVALVGMTVWFAAPGAFWTFAATAASARHVPAATISLSLAVGNAVGLVGSIAAAWQGARWGRGGPILLATAGLSLSVLMFAHVSTLLLVAVALAAFNTFWNYAAVYQMGLVVARDRIGKISLGISAAQMVGFAAGGFLSGFGILRYGFAELPIIVALFAVAGFAVVLCVLARPAPAVIRDAHPESEILTSTQG